jgi:hypothetical protein
MIKTPYSSHEFFPLQVKEQKLSNNFPKDSLLLLVILE